MALLSNTSMLGKTLHTLVGYDAQPAGMQLVFYAITAALIALGMRLTAPPQRAKLQRAAH